MKAAILLGVASLLLSGCGGGSCPAPSGSYRTSFVLKTGDCGAIADTVGPVDMRTPLASLGCSGTRTASADACDIDANKMKCPSGGTGAEITGTLHWNADSSVATGLVSLSVTDAAGTASCNGSYEVTYTKI